MGITNDGTSGMALLMDPLTAAPPDVNYIGSGSGTFNAVGSRLFDIHSTLTRIFTSTDNSVLREVTWTSDWSSVEMSGLTLSEFGTAVSGGNIWNHEIFGSVLFNGTQELQIQTTFQIF